MTNETREYQAGHEEGTFDREHGNLHADLADRAGAIAYPLPADDPFLRGYNDGFRGA